MGAPLNELPIYVWMDQWDNDFNQERMGALLPKMHLTWKLKQKSFTSSSLNCTQQPQLPKSLQQRKAKTEWTFIYNTTQ